MSAVKFIILPKVIDERKHGCWWQENGYRVLYKRATNIGILVSIIVFAMLALKQWILSLCVIDKLKQVRMSIHSFRPHSHPEKFSSFYTKTIEIYETKTSTFSKHQSEFATYWGACLVFAMGFPIERRTRAINEGRHIKLCLDRNVKFKSKHTTSTHAFEPAIKVTKLSIVRTIQQMKVQLYAADPIGTVTSN